MRHQVQSLYIITSIFFTLLFLPVAGYASTCPCEINSTSTEEMLEHNRNEIIYYLSNIEITEETDLTNLEYELNQIKISLTLITSALQELQIGNSSFAEIAIGLIYLPFLPSAYSDEVAFYESEMQYTRDLFASIEEYLSYANDYRVSYAEFDSMIENLTEEMSLAEIMFTTENQEDAAEKADDIYWELLNIQNSLIEKINTETNHKFTADILLNEFEETIDAAEAFSKQNGYLDEFETELKLYREAAKALEQYAELAYEEGDYYVASVLIQQMALELYFFEYLTVPYFEDMSEFELHSATIKEKRETQ